MELMWLLLYPLWASYWCLRKPLKPDLLHWLMWFVGYEISNCMRYLLWWVPFFDVVITIILIMLYVPMFTSYFRKNVLFVTIKGIKKSIVTLNEVKNMEMLEIQSKIHEYWIYMCEFVSKSIIIMKSIINA